jgi:glycogen operon protein
LNLSNSRVLQMVMDSLRYWATDMRIDGFRFDLATILGREPGGFEEDGRFLDACRQDPTLSQVKLIAEPWDMGPGGYQVGRFSPGWAEWNDAYRDTVRAYWRGDGGQLPKLASRMTASADLFAKRGRKPWASINFLTAHDGFTLTDIVSYNDKHNEANGEDNRDGHSHNLSCNYGAEGPTDDPEIQATRLVQMRNMLATLILSRGTPMLLGGDEFGRSQHGNNNSYCQDNEISWIDWEGIGPNGRNQAEFVRKLLMIRRALPMLRRGRFLTGSLDEEIGVKDVTWLTPAGQEMTEENWGDANARSLGILLDGRAQETGTRRVSDDSTLLFILNAHTDVVPFALPKAAGGGRWIRLIDTHQPADAQLAKAKFGQKYDMPARALVLFVLQPARTPQRTTAAERSFQRVVQAVEEASLKEVRFGFD